MRCIKCNEELEIDDNFCPKCGELTPHGYVSFKNKPNEIKYRESNLGSIFTLVALLIIVFTIMTLISGKDIFRPYIEIKKQIYSLKYGYKISLINTDNQYTGIVVNTNEEAIGLIKEDIIKESWQCRKNINVALIEKEISENYHVSSVSLCDVYEEEALKIKKEVALKGQRLLLIKQKHLGSDKLPEYIKNFTDYLEKSGVEILPDSEVTDIKSISKEEHEVFFNDKMIKAKKVVVAPGRTGAKWIQELADKYKIPYVSQSIEIGVRVEVRKEILEDITNVIYDPTIFIKTKTYGDEIRTFCTNPGGFVTKENYYGYICVNGHSLKETKSNNSNFAFISKVNLTYPVTNTREYGESIAHIANVLGDSKPIIQTLKDLKQSRRSKWDRIDKLFIEPTLKDCVAGDLALVMPHRIIVNILEGLEELDKIIPGVNNDETLLYGPEIKFFSNEITTNKKFKLEDYDVYFIGDGAGKAGNIVVAAATGLVAARDILKNME